MRHRLLLTPFAIAHVLALFGPLAWVRVLGPLLHPPTVAEPVLVAAVEAPVPTAPAQAEPA
jgi:hypothetical protein